MKFPKSVVQEEKKCFLCGTVIGLDPHHAIEGAYHDQAEDYGIWIWLCRKCHRKLHDNEAEMKKIRAIAQKKAMKYYGWKLNDWLFIFGRSFLE